MKHIPSSERFQKNNIAYALVTYNFPSFVDRRKRSFLSRLRNITFKKILIHLFYRLPFWLLRVQPATIIMVMGGGEFDLSMYPISERTDMLRVHYFDYDIYLEEMKKDCTIEEDSCIFIDNYLPFHSDFQSQSLITSDKYYSLLINLFDYIENRCGVKVIIAAHPRANYETCPDCFGKRKIIKGRTAELIRKSKFVVLHDSASISFAVLFKKPALFITTKNSPSGRIWL